jgi:hypothetical protein
VSKEGQARRLTQTKWVVEKALRARLQKERIRRRWLEGRERWIKGETFGFTRGQIESFLLNDEFWYGPLSEEDFAALKEAWKGIPQKEGPPDLKEICTTLYKKREYYTATKWRWDSPYRHWEGWKGEEGP